jgi:hypothetical protein
VKPIGRKVKSIVTLSSFMLEIVDDLYHAVFVVLVGFGHIFGPNKASMG